MELMTFVDPIIYKYILKKGYMWGDKKIIESKKCFNSLFSRSYSYMIEQMDKRFERPKNAGYYPLWAYLINNATKKDTYYHWAAEQYRVRIIFDIDPSIVLLSNYELYHCVMNGGYIFGTEEHDFYYDVMKRMLEPHHTWNEIFDEKYTKDPNEEIQATFWVLTKDMIKEVNYCYPKCNSFFCS